MQEYDKQQEQNLQAQITQLKKEKSGDEIFIVVGFIAAFLGGLLGIIMGYTYSQSTKSGPSKKKYYVYE